MPTKPDEIRIEVPLSKIDFSSQHRPRIENTKAEKDAITKCVDAIKAGVILPPIKVVEIGDKLHCFDGFIRKSAYYEVYPNPKVTVEIYKGEWKDFLRCTAAVNRNPDPHGLLRSEEDTLKVLYNVLDDKDLANATNVEVMEWTGFKNRNFINNYRKPIVNNAQLPFAGGDAKPTKNPTTTQGVGEYSVDNGGGKGVEIEVLNPILDATEIKNKINTTLDVLLMKNPHYKSRDEINLVICLKHIGEISS